jgi:hypothetical protein
MSPAISALLLIMLAIGAGASVYAIASSYRPTNINVAVDDIHFGKGNSASGTWIFTMNVHNIGNVPVTITGTVTGTAISNSISSGTLNPDDRAALKYLWTAGVVPGEHYLVTWTATGTEGSKKTVLTSVTADG